jgi:hypothetical protein
MMLFGCGVYFASGASLWRRKALFVQTFRWSKSPSRVRNRKTCVARKSATCGHILHGDTLCRLAYPATPPHRHGVLCILLFWPCWLKQVLPATCVVPDTWFHVPPTSQSLSLSNGAALDPQGVGPTPEVEHCRFYACGHSQSAGTAKGAPWGRGATVAKCEEDFEGQDNAIAWLWGGGPLKIKIINQWERIRSCPLAPTCQSTCVASNVRNAPNAFAPHGCESFESTRTVQRTSS